MHTMCSGEIFTKKCQQQQIFDSDLQGAWHYNHVTFTPIAKNFVILYIDLYVIHSMCQTYDKIKDGYTRELQSRMVPSPPKKKTGSSHLKLGSTPSTLLHPSASLAADFKVFRYSFPDTIPKFFNHLKRDFNLVRSLQIFTSDWL